LLCIARSVSRFDVIAIQEAKDNLKALRHLLKALGPNWGLSLTTSRRRTRQRRADGVPLRHAEGAALRAHLRAGRARERLDRIEPGALRRQFARTPYAASFRSGSKTFILVTLHVLYGESEEERLPGSGR
jgi:hypothetical protein